MQITTNNQSDSTMSLLQKPKGPQSQNQKSNPSANHKLAMLQANQAAMAAMATQHTKRASQLARLQNATNKPIQVDVIPTVDHYNYSNHLMLILRD
jgi:hypothetical protein